MKHFIITTFVLLMLALTALPLYGKQDKEKSEPPGQAKKEEHPNNQTGTEVQIGSVEQVTNTTVVVEDKKNGKKNEVSVDKTTKVIGKDKKTLNLKSIKLKDMVAIVGSDSADIASDGAKKKRAIKIFVKQLTATESAQLKRRAIHGIIQNIAGSILTVVHQIHQNRVYNVVINDNTIVKSKNQTASGSASLTVGQRIVAMGDPQNDGTLLARRIHIIPGLAKGVFRRFNVASPSATVTPTATVSPTLTITPTETTTPSATLTPTPTP